MHDVAAADVAPNHHRPPLDVQFSQLQLHGAPGPEAPR